MGAAIGAAIEGSACGKVILCGEHAVVYGRPAIALPLPNLRARARIEPIDGVSPLRIAAPDVHRLVPVDSLDDASLSDDPLARIAQLTLRHVGQAARPATLTVTSDIPVGANLGSGAAVSIAIARAIAAWFGQALTPADASALAFDVERIHHGTPSGIDNTVVAYEQPVWFIRGCAPAPLAGGDWGEGLPLLIADTGVSTPTRVPVGEVRTAWQRDRARHEALFDDVAAVVRRARGALESGDWPGLGAALNDNHALLKRLNVSSKELDMLCDAARAAGALGAKMSGGGRGGNMIALARDGAHVLVLKDALLQAGATRVFI